MGIDRFIHNPALAAGPTGLYVARRGGPEIFLPATGAPIAVTSGAAIMGWGAWTAVATPTSDFVLSQINATVYEISPTLNSQYVFELSYGPGNTPLDATRYNAAVVDLTADMQGYIDVSKTCRHVTVPAGNTIYARLATAGGTRTGHIWLVGWDSALPTWVELTSNVPTGPGRYYPSNNALIGITVALGAAWAYGASSTVVAAAPNDLVVDQVIALNALVHFLFPAAAIQVGYGPAAGEIWCATVPVSRSYSPRPIYPPVWVRSGERLALRGAAAGASSLDYLAGAYDL